MTRKAEVTLTRAARALPFLVALSGAAALVYESLWMRSFGLIFGNTTSAVAWVLAVFLGGLAIGSALAARRPSRDPLRDYGRVELAVGVAALVTLPLLRALPWAYGALVARAAVSGTVEAAGRVLLAALVLLPATVLLGATVPLALAFLERAGWDVRAGFGRLYLLNTLGGALGIALAGFVLMEALGVRGTLVAAAAASLFVGGVALRWSREIGPVPAAPGAGVPPAAPGVSPAPGLGLALAAVSGAATFGVELLWTRSLVLVIGSTSYAFHTMLLAVLLGIALGSAVYARWRERIVRPARAVGIVFACAGLGVVAGQWLIGQLPSLWLALVGLLPVSFAAQQLASLVLCLLVLLPVTGLLGLSFPMLLHLAEVQGTAQRAAGRLYAWNTLAAVAAALVTDLWLLPALGLQPPYLAFAGLLLAGALYALLESAGVRRLPKLALVAALAVALAAIVPRWKPWDPVLMSSGVHRYGLDWSERLVPAGRLGDWLRQQRSLLFYREGTEAVVAVSEPRGGAGRRFLSVNGKTDAGSGVEDVVTQKFIAHVPMLLHSGPRQVLVIGWGAGATAASVALHPVASLECVEIEQATWDAAPFFAELSSGLARDPRFRITIADGRNHLLRTPGRYDVIVSEPSNPWISGVSNLFTREFYEAARAALAPAGVFGQWFHYYNLDPSDVKVELATFLSVFPNASLWLVPPTEAERGRPPSRGRPAARRQPGAAVARLAAARPGLRRPAHRCRPACDARAAGSDGARRDLGHGTRGDQSLGGGRGDVPLRPAAQHGRLPVRRAGRPPPQRDPARRGSPRGSGAISGAEPLGRRPHAPARGSAAPFRGWSDLGRLLRPPRRALREGRPARACDRGLRDGDPPGSRRRERTHARRRAAARAGPAERGRAPPDRGRPARSHARARLGRAGDGRPRASRLPSGRAGPARAAAAGARERPGLAAARGRARAPGQVAGSQGRARHRPLHRQQRADRPGAARLRRQDGPGHHAADALTAGTAILAS